MFDMLRTFLARLAPIPDTELADFAKGLVKKEYPRGTFFTQVGDTHDRVGFVLRGIFRVYYLGPDGEMHIRNFCHEGKPLGSFATILTGKPAHVAIEAVEDAVVLQYSYNALAARFAKGAAWERLGRRIAEEHYISRERREHSLLTLDARGRMARFREDFPGLEPRLSRGDIASYIGVRPETLSRLLKKKKGSF